MSVFSAAPIRFFSASMVTATLGQNDPEVGQVYREGDETYRFVYNAGSSTISPGYCAILSGVTGYSVSVSSTTMIDIAVGLCKHAAIATGSYGSLLIEGFAPVQMGADNSGAAGALLGIGVDGTVVAKTLSTGFMAPAIGKLMSAAASGTSGMAYVRCF